MPPMPPLEVTNETRSSEEHVVLRSACTECQRRKQKCNREWPCSHCQKRKVADKCLFRDLTSAPSIRTHSANTPSVITPSVTFHENRRKRELSPSNDSSFMVEYDSIDDDDGDNEVESLEALGYMTTHHFTGLTTQSGKARHLPSKEYYRDIRTCPQLERALQVLPPRPYTDSLVQNFLSNVNYHYYILYPSLFLEQYQAWWSARSENRPIGVQWTSLLLMICACATQYTDLDLQRKLELDLGQSIQKLTEMYHDASRELHAVVPVGHHHILSVQQLLHSCYWFKSEARFVECWHVLNTAIREAQELGIHQETQNLPVPEFERELRRRVWCVMDTWDWQISALLSRPMIIDRADCDVQLPSLSIEAYSPSPMLHMKLQSQLIGQLAKRFGLPKNVVEPADIFEYQAMLEAWTQTFPPTYSLQSPDTSQDATYPWIVLHRHYLYTVAFSMLLDPVRSCFAEKISSSSPPERLRIRKDGITYALKLMGALYGFFDHVYPRDAKFHFVIFTIFDTAAVLATVILHDEDQSAPLRSEILDAIESAYEMVIRLSTALPAAITYRDILSRLRKKVMRHLRMLNPSEHEARRKRARVVRKPLSALSVSQRSKMPPSSEPPPIMSTPAGSKSQSSANAPGVDSGAKLPASNSVDVPPEHEPKSASILNTSLEGTQPTQSSVRHFEVPSTIMTHPSEQDGQTPKTMTEATRPRLVRPTFVPPAGPTIEPHYGADTTPALNVAPAPTPEAAGEHMLHTASVPVLRPSPLPVVESGSILEATPEQQQESHGQPTTVSPAPTFPGSSLPRGQAGLSELDTFDFMHYMPSFLPSQNNSWVDTLHPTNEFSEEVLPTVFADLIGPSGQVLPNLGDTTMSLNDLGQLGDLWRWQSLDLDLVEDGQASNQSNQTPSQTSDEPPTQQQGS